MLLTALARTLARRLASALALLGLAVLIVHGAARAHEQVGSGQLPTLARHAQLHTSPDLDVLDGASGDYQSIVTPSCCDGCAAALSTLLGREAASLPVALFEAPAPVDPPAGLDLGGHRRPPRRAVIA